MKKLQLILSLLLLSNLLFASDITEVVPLSNRVLLVHFDDGYAIHHKLGQPTNNESIVDNPLNVANAVNINSYFLSSSNDAFYITARRPDNIGRKTKPTDFISPRPNSAKDYVLEHWVYLFIPQALQSGKSYTLTTGSLAANGNTYTFTFDEKNLRSEIIHVNNIGYTQLSKKKYGYIYQWLGDKGSMNLWAFNNKPFNLINTANNQVVFTGTVKFRKDSVNIETEQADNTPNNNFLGATVFDCDFSSFNIDGNYKLVVPGIGCSFPFEIKRDLYRQVYKKVAKGLYQQRSGIALVAPYVNTPRPAPHNPLITPGFQNKLQYTKWRVYDGNSTDADGGDVTAVNNLAKGSLNNVWGWYQDAGDWDSYFTHAKVPLMMLNTFEVAPNNFAISELNMAESTNQLPDFLDEARWQIRFYYRLRKELISTGFGTGGVGGARVLGDFTANPNPPVAVASWQDNDHVWWISGEEPWLTYKYAGLAAQFAFILKKYCLQDPEGINWEQEAIAAYQWAKTNTKPGDDASKFSDEYFLRNDRSYAAASLYRLTKQAAYNTQAIADLAFLVDGETLHYPNDGKQWGILMYTMAGLEPGVTVNAATFTKCKNTILNTNQFFFVDYNERSTRWRGNVFQPMGNGQQTTPLLFEAMMGLGLGKKLGIDDATLQDYKDKLYLSADYFLGTNASNTTWVSGLGERSPNQDIFQYDGWYNGTNTMTDGIVPYGATKAYSSNFSDNTAFSPDYPINAINGTKIYPVDYNKWPGHERWFNQRMAPATCEYTIHQTTAPALCVYAFLADVVRDASCTVTTGSGTGLSGNYYNNVTLTGAPVYSKIEAVNFTFGTGSPNASVTADNFSAKWEGEVQAPVNGVYAFSTVSDDGVRLFVNNVKIIDNFTDHGPTTDNGNQTFTFVAGTKYKIKMEYYERAGGAVAKLLWTVPGQAQTAIPVDRLYPVVTVVNGTGLSGNYFNNATLTGTPVYSKIEAVNFDWGSGTPNASVNDENFSARWEGEVLAPVSGVYSFSTISDDGVRLFVNNVKIIDNFIDHYITTDNGNQTFAFTAGTKYKIKMEYFERTGGAVAKLLWTVPGQAQVAIPLSNLFPLVTTALRLQKTETIYTKEIQISPNPAHENTRLSFYSEKPQAVNISITDVNGRVVKRSRLNASEGFNTMLLQLPAQAGMYIIQVIKNGKTEIKKIGVN